MGNTVLALTHPFTHFDAIHFESQFTLLFAPQASLPQSMQTLKSKSLLTMTLMASTELPYSLIYFLSLFTSQA
jgi:hypothetical protein